MRWPPSESDSASASSLAAGHDGQRRDRRIVRHRAAGHARRHCGRRRSALRRPQLRSCPSVTAPGRSRRTLSSRQLTMVDSRPDLALAAIEDHLHGIAEFVLHMLGARRAESVRSGWPKARRCRRRRHRAAGAPWDAKECGWRSLSWPPVTTSCTASAARQHQRQRARPEGLGQLLGLRRQLAHPAPQVLRRWSMCTITGCEGGRSLSSKTLRTAAGLEAFAPRP